MKTLLGISEHILKRPCYSNQNLENITDLSSFTHIADSIDKALIQVLVESWLRSGITDSSLWRVLEAYFPHWTHRQNVVQHWNIMTRVITKKVISQIYYINTGRQIVVQ
jgi:hypothetical protein